MEKLNIYEKLQIIKVALSQLNLKKTGKNQSMKYFELGDFLPSLNALLMDHKLITKISFGRDLATLTIINAEKPDEQLIYTSPMSTANLRHCHEVQNLGAVQTYLRRYLYMNAFDIVEGDILDGTLDLSGKKEDAKPAKAPAKQLTDAQVKRLYTIAGKKDITNDQVKAVIKKDYEKDSANDLTKKEYDELVKRLEAK